MKNIKRSLLELYGQELVAICVLGHDGLFSDKMLRLYYLLFFSFLSHTIHPVAVQFRPATILS